MRVTRRFWALTGAGCVLALLSILFERPLLLVGAAGSGAVLLAAQFLFVRRVTRLDRTLEVDLSLPRAYLTEGEAVPVTLRAAAADSSLAVTVTARTPASASGPDTDERRVALDGDGPASTTFLVDWPIAGTATFPSSRITARDPTGLFAETVERGPTPSVTVEPRTTRSLHVGQGGDQALATFGEHPTGELGEGLDPAELRKYVSGDSAGDIDWKATARLNEPYVREHEVQTDRQTVLVVDHRERFGRGQPGERKLDYLREVALAFADRAGDLEDPLGMYTVGDGGLTGEFDPSTTAERYRVIRDALYDLDPTSRGGDGGTGDGARLGPGSAQRANTVLRSDESAFGRTLRPYLGTAEGYVKRIERDSLFATVETYLSRLKGVSWVVLFTDDRNRTELREAVKLARADGDHVVVFLTPDVLFEPGELGDLDSAYEQYAAFEELRRELTSLDRVTAFEVGPGDRIDAILSAARQ